MKRIPFNQHNDHIKLSDFYIANDKLLQELKKTDIISLQYIQCIY
jgi:hypothetical protein